MVAVVTSKGSMDGQVCVCMVNHVCAFETLQWLFADSRLLSQGPAQQNLHVAEHYSVQIDRPLHLIENLYLPVVASNFAFAARFVRDYS